MAITPYIHPTDAASPAIQGVDPQKDSPLLQLSIEVIRRIFSHLDIEDAILLLSTCRFTRDHYFNRNEMWMKMFNRHFFKPGLNVQAPSPPVPNYFFLFREVYQREFLSRGLNPKALELMNSLEDVDLQAYEGSGARANPRTLQALEDVYARMLRQCRNMDMKDMLFPLFAFDTCISMRESLGQITPARPGAMLKLNSVLKDFYIKVLDEMVNAYATQPLEAITPASFRQMVNRLVVVFEDRKVPIVDSPYVLEAHIRAAIKAAHDDLRTISNEFLDASPDNPHVEAARLAKPNLEAQKKEIEDELNVLNGTWFNGTLEAAFKEQRTAQVELVSAQTDCVTKFIAEYNVTITTPMAVLMLDLSFSPELNAAKLRINEAYINFEAKNEVAQGLHNRKVKLEDKLATVLDRLARTETTRMGRFYRELDKTVTHDNAEAAFIKLHRIIDNN